MNRSRNARRAWCSPLACAGLGPQILFLLLAGCTNSDAQVDSPVVLGMTDKMAAYYSDQELTMYEAQLPVQLPVRKPTQQDLMGLPGNVAPYPRQPYLLDSDETVEVRYTVSNLDDQQHVVELLLDPWNEFVRYRPGVTVVNDEETVPNFSGFDKFLVVPGKGRVVGTITADDTREMSVDLATAQNIMAMPPDAMAAFSATGLMNRAFNLQNRSTDNDPVLSPWIPKVIAGLTGFDLGIRTYEPANVAIEITTDVTDLNGNRILSPGSTDAKMNIPGKILAPPGAR
jgi:hypothetical protein